MKHLLSRRLLLGIAALTLLFVVPSVYLRWLGKRFPPDTTPEGAYLRIVLSMTQDRPQDTFAYLETESQWACFTLLDYRKKTSALVASSYPEPERSRLLTTYHVEADATDGADLFAREARTRGWLARLRRDLSGVDRVEIQGDRATVQTAHGTRYPFRRRENGIWGLTLFTAELRMEAERAARDLSVVEKAAADYRAAAGTDTP